MPLKKFARLRDRVLGPRFALCPRQSQVAIAATARLQPGFETSSRIIRRIEH